MEQSVSALILVCKVDQYKILGRVGEGAHGVVFKGKHIPSGDLVALKKVLLKKIEEGIANTALREMKALQEIENHENIIELREVIPQGMGFMLVFEFMYSDLSEVIKNYTQPLTQGQIKRYMVMLLKGVSFCHSIKIMHRDLKPANLLISSTGVLKIADFGLARVFDGSKNRPYSHQVATRWYRAPELLFSARIYDEGVDLWAVGCIFGEILNSSPLFHGDSDIEQICCVLKVLGEPNEELWPNLSHLPDFNKISFPHFVGIPLQELIPEASSQAISLIKCFLIYDSSKRLAASEALLHDYFFTTPLPCPNHQLPTPPRKSQPSLLDFDVDVPINLPSL